MKNGFNKRGAVMRLFWLGETKQTFYDASGVKITGFLQYRK